jgi:hypothetical protein
MSKPGPKKVARQKKKQEQKAQGKKHLKAPESPLGSIPPTLDAEQLSVPSVGAGAIGQKIPFFRKKHPDTKPWE